MLREFGAVLDEGDGYYCPHTVRVFAGASASSLVDLGSLSLPLNAATGPKKFTLLKDHRTPVSVVKLWWSTRAAATTVTTAGCTASRWSRCWRRGRSRWATA